MLATGVTPDFVTVDGAEGGTGAAPPEFSNSVGMPMAEGTAFYYLCFIFFSRLFFFIVFILFTYLYLYFLCF
jgi:hypothetical protein